MKIELNHDAIAKLLKSPEVEADLMRRAQRIASAAGNGMEAESSVGANRARASVITATPDAMLAEASNRSLSTALDAGR